VIRNVVIHVTNEQPLLADLYGMPTPLDVSLVCTNVRMLDGKKPIFIDHADSVFVFPYGTIRFIEILAAAATSMPETPDGAPAIALDGPSGVPEPEPELEPEPDLELDEDFLRRIREV
jgi:hypothetical protein